MRNRIFLWLFAFLIFSAFKADRSITVFMIGDSTMANKSLEGGNPERGWGHVLPGFFSENIKIDNHAMNGRSSKSFIDEGRWEEVISQVKKGDYVFIQFGHNDEKIKDSTRYTNPETTFKDNLRRFVKETRSKGGIPVLFNSIARRNFDVNGLLTDTHGRYREAPAEVAKELKVIYIDMNKITSDLVQGLGTEPSKKLYMWVPQNTVPCCPKGKEDDTHLNVHGARVVAGLAVNAIGKVIPELGKEIRHYDYVVAQDGSGDFFTVQEAINAVPDFRKEARTTILIRKGVYKEKLIIPTSKINISLVGQEGAVISYDDYASKKNVFGENKSTSGSASCYIYAPDFFAENITFENTSGPVGQAVAVFIDSDRVMFRKCRFLGFQDTLYTYGKQSREYYEDCYIEGTVDFIFGWSTAVFNRCTIHSKGNGYITAPSTDQGKAYGYTFFDCKLTAAEGVDKVCLARPWRPYAKAVYIRCEMEKHIIPQGWDNWGKKEAEKNCFFAEYQSRGEGANVSARALYSHQLKNLKDYEIEQILSGEDGWNPAKNGVDKLIQKVR